MRSEGSGSFTGSMTAVSSEARRGEVRRVEVAGCRIGSMTEALSAMKEAGARGVGVFFAACLAASLSRSRRRVWATRSVSFPAFSASH